MSYRPHFEACPFCGRSSSSFVVNAIAKGADPKAIEDEASLCCACGVTMKAKTEQERFEPILGDLYRRIPAMRALDVLAGKWNCRTGVPSSCQSGHSGSTRPPRSGGSPRAEFPPGEAGPLRQGRGGVKREILIKGMDMPSLYKTYKVRFSETDGGKIVVGIANEDSTEYAPAGEAVFVPPHGRLIDADILYRVAADRAEKRGDTFNEMDNVLSPRSIAMTPTVLPADEGGPSFGGCGGDGA